MYVDVVYIYISGKHVPEKKGEHKMLILPLTRYELHREAICSSVEHSEMNH